MDGGFRFAGEQLVRPVVGIIKNPGQITGHVVDMVEANGHKADLTVVRAHKLEDVLTRAAGWSGLIILGSRTNVHPSQYGQKPDPKVVQEFDPERDSRTLPLIRAMVKAETPVLAICRGAQETNVALGGKLLQRVSEWHRPSAKHAHGHKHYMRLAGHEMVTQMFGNVHRIPVNSLHRQGMLKHGGHLADGLVPLGWAADGLVEMFTIDPKKYGNGWVLGVQFHPEKQRPGEEKHSHAVMSAFGAAVDIHFGRKIGKPNIPNATVNGAQPNAYVVS